MSIYDSSADTVAAKVCLVPFSKDATGTLFPREDPKTEICRLTGCTRIQTQHQGRVTLASHAPCDKAESKIISGPLSLLNLATLAMGTTASRRGFHTAEFEWLIGSLQLKGLFSGVTHTTAHRVPGRCTIPRRMEGRFTAEVLKSDEAAIRVGSSIIAVYRFDLRTTPNGFNLGGTLEGVLSLLCG